MLIKALLPLIAVLKYKCDNHEGEYFGQQVAQVYKGCKEEINSPQQQAKATQPAH